MAMDASELDARISALAQSIEELTVDAQDEATRKKLLGVVEQAQKKLESPMDVIWKLIMSPHAPSAIMVLIKMGVVTKLVEAGEPQTSKELSTSCSADETLIIRMMRPAVALGLFNETGVQTYESTPISQLLTTPPLLGGYQFMYDLAHRSLTNMPRFLDRTGYKHVNGSPGPFQDSNNTEDGMFAYLMKHPEMMNNFNAFMAGSLKMRPEWFKAFPVHDILLKDAKRDDSEAVLLVDIGGGEGHDVAAFRAAYPDAPGKLILQDLPPVIDNIKSLDAGIERQKHDFFTPQPVKGARAYYMRYIFHDWPDHSCVEIMKHIADAMVPGYSKFLIFEWVLPAKDVPLYPAQLDINMMVLLNGMERTEEQWIALLSQAGLKVTAFHKGGDAAEGLIEAELAI